MKQDMQKRKAGGKQMTGRLLESFKGASTRLNVSYWALWRGAEAGFFRTIYVGGRRMIPEAEIQKIADFGFGPGRKRSRKTESTEHSEAR
jgi:hypothetical protein